MSSESFYRGHAQWLDLMQDASAWFQTAPGQQLLAQERRVLQEELVRCFGSYLVHYGPFVEAPLESPQLGHCVRIGPPLPGLHIHCDERAWPIGEHAADAVVLQHGLDFSLSPHALLREAARAVRPGGHLLVVGINPWSLWGARSGLAHSGLGDAACIRASRVGDWLNLLGFALEKRRFGCYCPPLASLPRQQRLTRLERIGQRLQLPTGGFYLLVARKLMVGLRPLRQSRRERMGKLIPLPVAKVSRRDVKQADPHR